MHERGRAIDHATRTPIRVGGRLGRTLHLRRADPEAPIVVESREPLVYMLGEAAELEHTLMIEYLYAAFSLKRNEDEGLTHAQLDAVTRWRHAILGVAKQEMLHLAIVSNVLASLGASPHLTRPNMPQPAHHYPPGVRLALLPFSEQALRHFLFLERPEGVAFDDAEGLAAIEDAVAHTGAEMLVPHLQEFATVGHLYRSIADGLRHLAEKLGEETLFLCGRDPSVRGALFGWGELTPIDGLDAALAGIETIVEQGEGVRDNWREGHFGRFLNVLREYVRMHDTDPTFEPARPLQPAFVRPPESGAHAVLITDEQTARVADVCNVAYEVLLQLLYRMFARIDESDAQMETLADVSVSMMFDVIEPLGDVLAQMPVGPEHPGMSPGPTFELFYQPDYLLPHRRAAWTVTAEHLEVAASVLTADAEEVPPLLQVRDALLRHSASLRSGA